MNRAVTLVKSRLEGRAIGEEEDGSAAIGRRAVALADALTVTQDFRDG